MEHTTKATLSSLDLLLVTRHGKGVVSVYSLQESVIGHSVHRQRKCKTQF